MKQSPLFASSLLLFAFSSVLAQNAAPTPAALRVASAALSQVGVTIHYDPAYRRLPYPGGDLPSDRGVCTDVVIRAFRTEGVDLQKAVHEDMSAHFGSYPQIWGLRGPDSNIDHRRCPNLVTFFKRSGKALPVSARAVDYLPGDLVFWRLPSGVPHVGVVSDRQSGEGERRLVVHNIGGGALAKDVLFSWPITALVRFF